MDVGAWCFGCRAVGTWCLWVRAVSGLEFWVYECRGLYLARKPVGTSKLSSLLHCLRVPNRILFHITPYV